MFRNRPFSEQMRWIFTGPSGRRVAGIVIGYFLPVLSIFGLVGALYTQSLAPLFWVILLGLPAGVLLIVGVMYAALWFDA